MNFLDFIPEYLFEGLGFLAGISASFVIIIQILKEYKSKHQTSLSSGYVIGWGIIFFCWTLYGIRFNAIALWLTNSIAVILQIILYIVSFQLKKLK